MICKPLTLVLTLMVAMLAGCTPATSPANQPQTSQPQSEVIATAQPADAQATTPTTAPAAVPVTGTAQIDSVEIVMVESLPVQVQAMVRGNLADACTQPGDITQQQTGNTFQITFATVRPGDCIGAQVLTPFEYLIPLDVQGLPAGTYNVDVNGVQAEFILAVDNAAAIPAAGATTAPSGGGQTTSGVQETDVQSVMAQADVPIYGGAPGDTSTQIGFVAGGQVARVTGVSADGAWWRVMCPDDSVGDCWVAADPSQTQPTTAP